MPKLSPQQIFAGPLWPMLEQGRFLPSRILSPGVIPTSTNTLILPSSTNRAGIIFSTADAGDMWLSNNPMTAVRQGWLLPNQAGFVPLFIWQAGDCIQQEWYAFTASIGKSFGIIEVLFPDKN